MVYLNIKLSLGRLKYIVALEYDVKFIWEHRRNLLALYVLKARGVYINRGARKRVGVQTAN